MPPELIPCRQEAFECALRVELSRTRGERGIGTLGEKTLHSVLKHYFEPDAACHEIKVGGFVADIVNDDGIIEIQTRSLERLVKKLDAFLPLTKVTVVCPVVRHKYLCWINPDDGSVSKKRRSPRTGQPRDALCELQKLRAFIPHPNFSACILMLDAEEYRLLNLQSKRSRDGKKGSVRSNLLPTDAVGTLLLSTPADYACLLPDLPDEFTAKDFGKAAALRGMNASFVLSLFRDLNIIFHAETRGRAFVYKRLL